MSNMNPLVAVKLALLPNDEELADYAVRKLGLSKEVILRTLGSAMNGSIFRNQLIKLQTEDKTAELVARRRAEEEISKIEMALNKREKEEEAEALKLAQAMINALNPAPKPQPKLVPPPPKPVDPNKLRELFGLPKNWPSQIFDNKNWALAMQWLLEDNLRAVEKVVKNAADKATYEKVISDIRHGLGQLRTIIDRYGGGPDRTNYTVRNEVEQWILRDPEMATLITVPKPKQAKLTNPAELKKAEDKTKQHEAKVERMKIALRGVGFDEAAIERIVHNCLKKHGGDLLQAALGKRENADLVRATGEKIGDQALIAQANEELKVSYRYATAIGKKAEEFDAMYAARVQRKLTDRLVANNKPMEQKKPPFKKLKKNKKK